MLSTVYSEIQGGTKTHLDKQVTYIKNISVIDFNLTGEQMREYAFLQKTLGKGESAGMVYLYSTVTDFAKLRGWSTFLPLHTAI